MGSCVMPGIEHKFVTGKQVTYLTYYLFGPCYYILMYILDSRPQSFLCNHVECLPDDRYSAIELTWSLSILFYFLLSPVRNIGASGSHIHFPGLCVSCTLVGPRPLIWHELKAYKKLCSAIGRLVIRIVILPLVTFLRFELILPCWSYFSGVWLFIKSTTPSDLLWNYEQSWKISISITVI